MLCSGEYSIPDLIGVAKGYRYVLTAMWPAVGATDFPSTCTKFQVPYFIFDGVLDQNTPAALVQDLSLIHIFWVRLHRREGCPRRACDASPGCTCTRVIKGKL